MFVHGRAGLFALLRFALESVVDGLAKRIPQLLLQAALKHHGLGLGLPALLQGFDGVDPQHIGAGQLLGLGDQALAPGNAGLLHGIDGRTGGFHRFAPSVLHVCKGFFAHVAGIAPAVFKLVQLARHGLPVGALRMGQGPGLQFLDQGLALGLVGGGIGTHFLQPLLDHFVGLVASAVKALPQAMVGQTPLIGLLPLFAQLAQSLLHFSPTHDRLRGGGLFAFGGGRRGLEQGLGLLDQLGAQLIGAPALPALQLTRGQQHLVGVVLQFVIDEAPMFFERLAQSLGRPRAGLAVAQRQFLLEHLQNNLHSRLGTGALGRVYLGPLRGLCRWGYILSPLAANLIGPGRHGRHGQAGIGRGRFGLGQSRLKRLPHRFQLGFAGLHHGGEFGVHTGPVGRDQQGLGVGLPAQPIGLQAFALGQGICQGLGRQDLNPLGHQHAGLAVDLGLVLQVFNRLDPLGQLPLEALQGLARQRRTGFGGVALPSHGVGQVDAGRGQQGLRPLGPILGQAVLGTRAAQFVELFTQWLGRALVFGAELFVNLLQMLQRGFAGQPFAHTGGALRSGGGGESTTGQPVQSGGIQGAGRSIGHNSLTFLESKGGAGSARSPGAWGPAAPQMGCAHRPNRLLSPHSAPSGSGRHGWPDPWQNKGHQQ